MCSWRAAAASAALRRFGGTGNGGQMLRPAPLSWLWLKRSALSVVPRRRNRGAWRPSTCSDRRRAWLTCHFTHLAAVGVASAMRYCGVRREEAIVVWLDTGVGVEPCVGCVLHTCWSTVCDAPPCALCQTERVILMPTSGWAPRAHEHVSLPALAGRAPSGHLPVNNHTAR